ncbi:MAG: hypothetical protein RLZZ177_2414, partial [Pseudomonadota bacterium]
MPWLVVAIPPECLRSDKHVAQQACCIPDNLGMNPLLAKLQPYPFERL